MISILLQIPVESRLDQIKKQNKQTEVQHNCSITQPMGDTTTREELRLQEIKSLQGNIIKF